MAGENSFIKVLDKVELAKPKHSPGTGPAAVSGKTSAWQGIKKNGYNPLNQTERAMPDKGVKLYETR